MTGSVNCSLGGKASRRPGRGAHRRGYVVGWHNDRDGRLGSFPRECATDSRPANGARSFDLGTVAAPQMTGRRFPPPWSIEEQAALLWSSARGGARALVGLWRYIRGN